MENKRVTYLIKDLNHEIIRYICIADIDKQKMPTPAQMQILHFIISKQNEKIYQKDIGNALNLRRATLSEILKTMEKNDLIFRIKDQIDTRKKEIIISETAKNNFQIVKDKLNEAEKVITSGIKKEDLELFFKIINKMKENIKTKGWTYAKINKKSY